MPTTNDLATNMKGLWKSPDRSPDNHVKDGEWPEATTPPPIFAYF